MRTERSRRTGSTRAAATGVGLGIALIASGVRIAKAEVAAPGELRVCADPNNLPFSNRAGEGFENKIAELVAADLGKTVSYTWWAQRRGFVRNTLKAGVCDVVMGVASGYDLVETTKPYYRSTYVFVSRADRQLDLSSLKDPRLRALSIGVHLIGDDGTNTPPAHALSQEGIVTNVSGFMIYGDYSQADPPARLVEAVETGKIDIAAVWGPLAGYAAKHSPVPLRITPVADTADFAPLRFEFGIAMGVRRGDHALKAQLDDIITRRGAEMRAVLADYGVPLVPVPEGRATGGDPQEGRP